MVHTHLISRLPGSATPSSDPAAGDLRGRGDTGKESQPTAAYMEPWQGLGILCLSLEDHGENAI